MTTTTKRRVTLVVLAIGALVVGAAAAIGSLAGHREHIAGMQVHVQVAADGKARIEEAIDYDFGSASGKHGIYRDVPGLDEASQVSVSSDAPERFERVGEHIRIGDPDQTVTGRHRYLLGYTLVNIAPSGKVRINAVGSSWTVPIKEASIVIVGPYDWSGLRCDQGAWYSTGGCQVQQVKPGMLRVTAKDLDKNEGVTIYADSATPIASAPRLPAFEASSPHDRVSGAALFGVALLGALLAGLVATLLVRRGGREWVGGAAGVGVPQPTLLPPPGMAAAWQPPVGARRIDPMKLAEQAGTAYSPPQGMTAPQGGIVLDETVKHQHKVAWLVEAAASGAVSFDQVTGTEKLLRTDAPDRPLPAPLDEAFGLRTEIKLGSYDRSFADAWSDLGEKLEVWRARAGLWDPRGHRRRVIAAVGGTLAAIAGVALTFAGAFRGSLPLLGIGALIAGGGLGAVASSWELRMRTPMGSALWLQVESFRRFLHESEVQQVDWAAQNGLLRPYTAWAVALGEIDRWDAAVRGSTVAGTVDPMGRHLVFLSQSLGRATSAASTAPQSSSGGGGSSFSGGGGVGGGGGGGGGGSW